MAYGCEDSLCPLAPYFSGRNAELSDGRPLGDEDHDNVRIMNENAAELSALRDTVVDIVEGSDDDDDDDNNSPTPSPTLATERIVDQELDCPESNRCDDNEASLFLISTDDDEECKEVCVCREDCTVAEVGLAFDKLYCAAA